MSVVADMAAASRVNRGYAVLWAIAALMGLVGAVFHSSYAPIFELWKTSTYQYAFVVLPAVMYLIWSQRGALSTAAIAPSWPVVIVLFVLTMVWQVGRATAVQAVEHAAVILAVPAIVLAVLGRHVFGVLKFPLLLLLTLIPVWGALTPVLMVVTAEIASTLLRIFGIPFSRHGQFMSLPGGEFEVADICSGLHYLLDGVILALLFSYWNFRKPRTRLLFIASAAAICVVGNGVRAATVMMVASATQMRYFGGYDHVVFGMIFFAVLLTALFWIGSRYSDVEAGPAVAAAAKEPAPPVGRKIGYVLALAALVLALGPAMQAYRAYAADTQALQLQLPVLAGCEAPAGWEGGWVPQIHGADAQELGTYHCGNAKVHLLMVAYVNQTNGRELIGATNEFVPSEWWRSGAQARASVPLRDGAPLVVNQTQINSGARAMLAWHWYSVNGVAATTGYGVKLREALAMLALKPVESRAYVISVVGPAADPDALRLRAEQVVNALDVAARR